MNVDVLRRQVFAKVFAAAFTVSIVCSAIASFATDTALPNLITKPGIDIQPNRPTAGPRDLIIAHQSQPLEVVMEKTPGKVPYFSVAGGAFFSFSFDPLVFTQDAGEAIRGIKNRIQLDLMAAIGIANWFELDLAFPIILFQQTEDVDQMLNMQAIGDLSLTARVPFWRRLSYESGLGMALALRMNFPTGSRFNFASDGVVTYNPSLIVDYRFGFGGLITFQPGLHIRPGVTFISDNNTSLAKTLTLSVGTEMPIKRSWGLMVLAGFYINVLLEALPDVASAPEGAFKAGRAAGEGLLGLRWYSGHGVTYTTGFNIGGGCSLFTLPSFRYFLAAVFTPKQFGEFDAIQRFKVPPDTDGDGILDADDSCKYIPGTKNKNSGLHGCPERDGDTLVDFQDNCPDLPGRAQYRGCPRAYLDQSQIVILDRIHFATDQDTILPESSQVLKDIGELMKQNPLLCFEIGGHTDDRADDQYNLDLSKKRADAVALYLEAQGINGARLSKKGYGKFQPAVIQATTEAELAQNRRVTIYIRPCDPPASIPKTPSPLPPTQTETPLPAPQPTTPPTPGVSKPV